MTTPVELTQALAASPAARAAYDALPELDRQEYDRWIAAAFRADTRQRRAALAVEHLLG